MKGIIYPAFLHYCPGADTPAQKIFRLSTEDKRNVTASASLCRVIYQKDSWDYIAMLPSSKITKGTWKIFLRSCVYFSKFNPVWACHCPHWWSCSGWNSLRSTLLSPHTADVCRMYNEVCCSWSALTKARIKDYCPTTTLGWSLGETRVRSLGMKETPVLPWGDIWAILWATQQINAEEEKWATDLRSRGAPCSVSQKCKGQTAASTGMELQTAALCH